jgi:CheY-like chemotaxis protein
MRTKDSKTILLIDGNSTTRRLLAIRLQAMEFNVLEAGNEVELSIALGTSPDLIISDLQLPDLNGKNLFEKLQANRNSIFVFSETLPPNTKEELKEMKIAAFFLKNQRSDMLKKAEDFLTGKWEAEAPSRADGKKQILLIDDSSVIRAIVRRILEKNFPLFVIREAEDGKKAMSEMSNKKVDLIFSDLEMAGMGGEDFLQMLQNNNLLKNKPVIVLSSSITPELREGFKDIKTVRFLPKPSSEEEITATVNDLLRISPSIVP